MVGATVALAADAKSGRHSRITMLAQQKKTKKSAIQKPTTKPVAKAPRGRLQPAGKFDLEEIVSETKQKQDKVRFKVEEQAGALPPMGFWDPADFCKKARGSEDKKVFAWSNTFAEEDSFRKFREAELKHGRVAMLATVGSLVQHFVRIPAAELAQAPSGIQAAFDPNGSTGMLVLTIICGFIEIFVLYQEDTRRGGDYGDPLKLGMNDMDMQHRELSNGRFAMFAALAIIAAELASGKDAFEQLVAINDIKW